MTVLPKYRTFAKRIIAGIIDGFVFIPLDFAGSYLLDEFGNTFNTSWTLFQTIIWTLYVVIGHGKYGQTLGKKAMAVKVLDLDEKNLIGYKRAFIRESVWFVVSILGAIYLLFPQSNRNYSELNTVDDYLSLTISVWFILEIITMAFNSKRRALHDFMAKSVAIDMDELKRDEYFRSQQNIFESVQE